MQVSYSTLHCSLPNLKANAHLKKKSRKQRRSAWSTQHPLTIWHRHYNTPPLQVAIKSAHSSMDQLKEQGWQFPSSTMGYEFDKFCTWNVYTEYADLNIPATGNVKERLIIGLNQKQYSCHAARFACFCSRQRHLPFRNCTCSIVFLPVVQLKSEPWTTVQFLPCIHCRRLYPSRWLPAWGAWSCNRRWVCSFSRGWQGERLTERLNICELDD